MLRVTVELIPFGDELQVEVIGKAELWNDMTGTSEIGNYGAKAWITDNAHGNWMAASQVKNHPRNHVVWDLIRKALNNMFEGEPDES